MRLLPSTDDTSKLFRLGRVIATEPFYFGLDVGFLVVQQ